MRCPAASLAPDDPSRPLGHVADVTPRLADPAGCLIMLQPTSRSGVAVVGRIAGTQWTGCHPSCQAVRRVANAGGWQQRQRQICWAWGEDGERAWRVMKMEGRGRNRLKNKSIVLLCPGVPCRGGPRLGHARLVQQRPN